MRRGRMETLREALARLEARGYRRAFRATVDGELEVAGEPPLPAESFAVDETVRFEGESDPGDEAVLFALRTRDGRIRGTFVAAYGPHMEPGCAAATRRLAADPKPENAAPACRSRGWGTPEAS